MVRRIVCRTVMMLAVSGLFVVNVEAREKKHSDIDNKESKNHKQERDDKTKKKETDKRQESKKEDKRDKISSKGPGESKKGKTSSDASKKGTTAPVEQCTAGVHRLIPAAGPISGNAKDWAANARKLKFKVDKDPYGCSAADPCVLVFQPSYSKTINQSYGHVAAYYGGSQIADSNGICKEAAKPCTFIPDFSRSVEVIHLKN